MTHKHDFYTADDYSKDCCGREHPDRFECKCGVILWFDDVAKLLNGLPDELIEEHKHKTADWLK